jgi:hypothetical protein
MKHSHDQNRRGRVAAAQGKGPPEEAVFWWVRRKKAMGVWQGVAMDYLKFHPGLPCPSLQRPAGRPPLKRPYGRLKGGLPTGRVDCGRLLPLWRPHAVRL